MSVFSAWHHRRQQDDTRNLWLPLQPSLSACARRSSGGKVSLPADSPWHEFLRRDEWQHIHLSSLFVPQEHQAAHKQRLFAASCCARRAFFTWNKTQIGATLLWSESGRLLFDCLALRQTAPAPLAGTVPRSQTAALSYAQQQELERLLHKYPPRQFIGTLPHYEYLLRCCELRLTARFFLLMVQKVDQESSDSASPLGDGLRLERLSAHHYHHLLPLEQAYYCEEVLWTPPERRMLRALEKHCANRLQCYLQYGIFAGSELVARAMINNYGLHYWQIGGIYTVPRWRRQGLATHLLRVLCAAIVRCKRLPTLFVRTDNPSADALYRNSRFEALERMVIAQDGP